MNQITIKKLSTPAPKSIPATVEIILVGLTPGKQQHRKIENEGVDKGAFAGGMRTNFHRWFCTLGIDAHFDLKGPDDLFERGDLVHRRFFTSLLRDPVYSNDENYSGRNPFPWEHPELAEMMERTFELLRTADSRCLIIPCGQVVSQALMVGLLDSPLHDNVLYGFPHPSPLNGHANREFEENYPLLKLRCESVLQEKVSKHDKTHE